MIPHITLPKELSIDANILLDALSDRKCFFCGNEMRAYCGDQTSIECKHMIVRYSLYPYKCYQFRIFLDAHISLKCGANTRYDYDIIKDIQPNTYLDFCPIITIDPFDVR